MSTKKDFTLRGLRGSWVSLKKRPHTARLAGLAFELQKVYVLNGLLDSRLRFKKDARLNGLRVSWLGFKKKGPMLNG